MRILPSREYKSGTKWCIWRWKDIYPCDDGELYLARLHLIQTPLFVVMLHYIFRADPQLDLHNHPVNFLSIILRGSYDEQRFRQGDSYAFYRHVKNFNLIKANDYHRIVQVWRGPVITLCFGGRPQQTWGFRTADGWVPWQSYKGGCK